MHIKLLILIFSIISCSKNNSNIVSLEELRASQDKFEKVSVSTKVATVKRGHGLFQSLSLVGIEGREALDIINNLRDKIEFSKLKVGDKISAVYTREKSLKALGVSLNPAEMHYLERTFHDNSWSYEFKEQKTQWRKRIVDGKLKHGLTLQALLKEKGLSSQVVANIINVLMCKVNFRFDAREGDQYKVLLKERMFNNLVIETKVLYTKYDGKRSGLSEAYFYEDEVKGSTYSAHYTEEGEALIRSALRYPLKRLHIRSHYGMRTHPVTGKRAMHRGVDLRARRGESVHSVANGIVIKSEFTKFGGNKVAIKHADNSVSYYLHLHKRFVRKGQRVKSFQKIGSVGSTGRVTGPHLHFGFRKPSGKWMNPMHKRMIATPKLKGEKFNRLQKQIVHTKVILKDLDQRNISENKRNKKNNNI